MLSPVAQRDLETWLVCLHPNQDHLVKLHDESLFVGCIATDPVFQSALMVSILAGEEEEEGRERAPPSETPFLYWALPQVWLTRDRSLV